MWLYPWEQITPLLKAGNPMRRTWSRSRAAPEVTSPADILVVAAGVRGLIGPEHVKPGATVIDVGIHRTENGLVGDVLAAELDGIAARITPVPGGVGPMTIAMLMDNTLKAAQWAPR